MYSIVSRYSSGGGGANVAFLIDEDDDIEECRRHIELIIDMCQEIKRASTEDSRYVFQRSIDYLVNQMDFIRKHEQRIN